MILLLPDLDCMLLLEDESPHCSTGIDCYVSLLVALAFLANLLVLAFLSLLHFLFLW